MEIIKYNPDEIKKEALRRLKEETIENLVKVELNKLKTKTNLWDKIFPYKILFIKKDKL